MGVQDEKLGERLARELVAKHLGACVERHDDGSRNSMPDGRIVHEDGRTGWLEVIADRSPDHERQWDARSKYGSFPVEDLRWAWTVHVNHTVHLKQLKHWLPSRLRDAEACAQGDPCRARQVIEDLEDVDCATPHDARPSGEVRVVPSGFSGSSTGAEELLAWLPACLGRHTDVAAEMAAAGPAEESHAFVWVTMASQAAFAMVAAGRGVQTSLPPDAPVLPDGITHLWLAGEGSTDRAVAWFPDHGWHEVSGHWTETPTGAEIAARRRQEDR